MANAFITRHAIVAAALLGLLALSLPAAAADKPAKKPSATKKAKVDKPKAEKPKSEEPKPDEPKAEAEAEAPSIIPADVTPAKATLRWKFKEGDERRYLMNQKMSMAMKVMGQNVETNTVQTMLVTWKVLEVDEDGGCKMEQKFESVRMKMAGPGIAGEYDSAKGTKFTGLMKSLNPLFDAMTAGEFKLTMTAQGKITEMEMPEDLKKALKTAPGGGGGVLSEDGLKQMVTQGSPTLPEEEMASGDDWTETIEIQAPPVGAMKMVTQYAYLGAIQRDGRQLEVISVNPRMQFDGKGQFTPEITAQKCEGALYFDNEQGYLVETLIQQKTEMKMSIAGNDINQLLNQTISMRQLAEGEEPPADPADKDAAADKPKDADGDQPPEEDDAKEGDEDEDKSEDDDEDDDE